MNQKLNHRIGWMLLIAIPSAFSSFANAESTPQELFQERLRNLEDHHRIFDDIDPSLGVIAKDFSKARSQQTYLAPTKPQTVVDWVHFSPRKKVTGDLPIHYDPKLKKWLIVKEAAEACSDAILRFTWYFLRAFEGLDEPLRQIDSMVSLGAAALVAIEVVYPENWSVVPAELVDPAAAVLLLEHLEPGTLQTCFTRDSAGRTNHVRRAMAALCLTSGKTPRKRALHDTPEQLLSAPIETAMSGRPLTLADLLPPDPTSLKALEQLLDKVTHPTLLGTLLAQSAPARHGVPTFSPDAIAGWQHDLDRLVARVQEDLSKRRVRSMVTTTILAGPGSDSLMGMLTDPGVTRPLLQLASQVAADHLWKALNESSTPESLAGALESHPATRTVMDLAGVRPRIEITSSNPDPLSPASSPARLVWDNLVRVPRSDPAAPAMFERMIIQLVDYKPMGQGREMPGIDPLTMVPVRVETPSGWNDQILPAGQIKAGLPVMGLSHIGSTGTGAPFPADPRQQTTWFRVGKTRIFEPPITLTVGLSNAMETDGADDRPGDENGEDKKAGAESGEGGMSQPLRLHLADDLTR